MTVFEKRVLRRVLEFKKEEETGRWLHLNCEQFRKIYFPFNIVEMIKSED